MALSQPKSFLWQKIEKEIESPSSSALLPCLDSSDECVEKLTENALAKSNKVKHLEEKIALINARLKVVGERIDYNKDKSWTSYVTIDPVKLLQNIFGGGDVQRDKIAIADLEIKTADLEAAKAELERQKEEEKFFLREKIFQLVSDIERGERNIITIQSQQETLKLQNEVFRLQYRFGSGSTEQLLTMKTKEENLSEQLTKVGGKQAESVRELLQLTGYKLFF